MSPAEGGEGPDRGGWLDSEDVRFDTTPDSEVVVSSRSYNTGSNGEGGTSVLGAVFLIVNAALGAGLLNFPQAYGQAGGVLTAMSIQVRPLFLLGTDYG
jgi:sodium-coupled neutral amino acid transporter 7/8